MHLCMHIPIRLFVLIKYYVVIMYRNVVAIYIERNYLIQMAKSEFVQYYKFNDIC